MAHYARVVNGVVVCVNVSDEATLKTGLFGPPEQWIQTSYNTKGGVHSSGGVPLRKNFAGIGYTYDKQRDAFIPPKPFDSWTLNEQTCLWDPPIPYPSDEKVYKWVDPTGWQEIKL